MYTIKIVYLSVLYLQVPANVTAKVLNEIKMSITMPHVDARPSAGRGIHICRASPKAQHEMKYFCL